MNELYLAGVSLLAVVGCTGIVNNEDPAALNAEPSSSVAAGGSGATTVSVGGSGGAGESSGGRGDPNSVVTTGGAAGSGGAPTSGACTIDALPPTIQAMLTNRCATCHGSVPLAMLPSLVSYASFTAPSKSDPTKTNAVVSLARLQSTMMRMPPAPGSPASASEISALQDFIAQGYPKPSCPEGTGGSGGASSSGGGSGGGGAITDDPLFAMPTCTSMNSWSGGNRGSASMNPGMACNACHKSGGEGPNFSVAGTVYPSGHEPDKCNSGAGAAGARVVIVGADGQTLTLTPNSVGNFSSRTAIKLPYQAKVTYQGRERLMLTAQTSGDCNSCHGQNASMLAPGRVTVP